jgi:putative flippase GtrA
MAAVKAPNAIIPAACHRPAASANRAVSATQTGSSVIPAANKEGLGISTKLEDIAKAGEDIIESREAKMFGRNTVASIITFSLDLAILWSLVELVGIPHVIAAVAAFIVPMILFYILERQWVFPGTNRNVATGFLYFMINVGIGFAAMLATFWALLEFTPLHYLLARVLASVVNGIVIFLLNGLFNFKQL